MTTASPKPQADDASRRDNLFEPGRYFSIPMTIMRRRDLTAAAKNVWQVIAGHLGPHGGTAWPSEARLAVATGLGRQTVIRAVKLLEDMGLAAVEKTVGGVNIYRLLQPDAAVGERDLSQNGTGSTCPKMVQVGENQYQNGTGEKQATSPKMGQHQYQNGTNQYQNGTRSTVLLKEVLIQPPNPPQAGGGEVVSPAASIGNRVVEKAAIGNRVDAGQQGLVDALVKAYCEEFPKATDIPYTWVRRIKRLNGNASLLSGITRADIQAARKRAAERKHLFGFQHVMRVMEAKSADEAKTSQKPDGSSPADMIAENQRRQDQERHEQAAREKEYFSGLPFAKQVIYRKLARPRVPATMEEQCPGATDALAGAIAWKDRPVNPFQESMEATA